MKVTFLGTGTSQGVPIIGCDCEVCVSEDLKDKRLRTSIKVEFESGFTFVIDTGPDFRYQMLRSNTCRLDAVVFTHDHKDHTGGLDDIRPFNYFQKKALNIYASEKVQSHLKQAYHYVFAEKKYPGIPQVNLKTIENSEFELDGKKIIPIEVLHYKLPVLGFRIEDFTYITDANFISKLELEKAKGSKVLVLNALRKEKHISHFNLEEAIAVAREINADVTYFTHISHQLGKHKDISATLPSRICLAHDGMTLNL